jgi:hypothetical protein
MNSPFSRLYMSDAFKHHTKKISGKQYAHRRTIIHRKFMALWGTVQPLRLDRLLYGSNFCALS